MWGFLLKAKIPDWTFSRFHFILLFGQIKELPKQYRILMPCTARTTHLRKSLGTSFRKFSEVRMKSWNWKTHPSPFDHLRLMRTDWRHLWRKMVGEQSVIWGRKWTIVVWLSLGALYLWNLTWYWKVHYLEARELSKWTKETWTYYIATSRPTPGKTLP